MSIVRIYSQQTTASLILCAILFLYFLKYSLKDSVHLLHVWGGGYVYLFYRGCYVLSTKKAKHAAHLHSYLIGFAVESALFQEVAISRTVHFQQKILLPCNS